jgi:tetratricopeptide (TPR) repeat protein
MEFEPELRPRDLYRALKEDRLELLSLRDRAHATESTLENHLDYIQELVKDELIIVALDEVRLAIDHFPQNDNLRSCYLDLLLVLHMFDIAETEYNAQLKSFGYSDVLTAQFGRLLVQKGSRNFAIEESAVALKQCPESLPLRLFEGFECIEAGQVERAYQLANECLILESDSAEAHSLLAACHQAVGLYGEAIVEAKLALRADPKASYAYITIAKSWSCQGHEKDALALLDERSSSYPVSGGYGARVAKRYLRKGSIGKAITSYYRLFRTLLKLIRLQFELMSDEGAKK